MTKSIFISTKLNYSKSDRSDLLVSLQKYSELTVIEEFLLCNKGFLTIAILLLTSMAISVSVVYSLNVFLNVSASVLASSW